MFFDIGRSARIRQKIESLNLAPFVEKAQELFGLTEKDSDAAVLEYRHFLYLVYWNKRLAGNTMVVPTVRADKLWHAHILYTKNYADMCHDILGTFLHHNPGLEEGSEQSEYAMKHTKRLHDHVYRDRGKPGFDEDYFSFVIVEPPRRHDSGSDSGSDTHFTTSDTPSDTPSTGGHGGWFGGGGSSGTWSSDSPTDSSSDGGGGCGGD